MLISSDPQIDLLKVKGAVNDDPALRLAIANQLGSADLTSPSLPPSSILVVRRFVDPLPQRLSAGLGLIHVDPEWESCVRSELSNIYHCAARPRKGVVVGDPAAILFYDEAELLACLSLDVSQGHAWTHWWWHTFLKSMPPSLGRSSCLKAALCHRARYAPAAFAHLNEWGKTDAVVKAMTPHDTVAVVKAMAGAYDLAHLISGLQAISKISEKKQKIQKEPTVSMEAEKSFQKTKDGRKNQPAVSLIETKETAPWVPVIGILASDQSLAREQVVLLGLALSLHKAPHVVRRSSFQQAVIDWWLGQDISSKKVAHRVQDPDHQYGTPDSAHLTKPADTIDPQEMHIQTRRRDLKKKDQRGRSQAALRQIDTETTSNAARQRVDLNSGLPLDHRKDQHTSLLEDPALEDFTEKPADKVLQPYPGLDLDPEGIKTRLGGVLYLINLMKQLDLPACFEPDWQPAACLGPWETLAILARALLSDADRELLHDPLWPALAVLDYRQPRTLPGNGFYAVNQYCLPISWWALIPQPDSPSFFWARRKKQLRIWSDTGVMLIDRPQPNNITKDRIGANLHPYCRDIGAVRIVRRSYSDAPVDQLNSPWMAGLGSVVLDWLALIVPFIRLHLSNSLNLPSNDRKELAKTLFFHPGELHVTASHVDLVMTLETISLPVRMAGLDRDPGWLADFGRVIAFHFN